MPEGRVSGHREHVDRLWPDGVDLRDGTVLERVNGLFRRLPPTVPMGALGIMAEYGPRTPRSRRAMNVLKSAHSSKAVKIRDFGPSLEHIDRDRQRVVSEKDLEGLFGTE
jgi:hypothetical protein